MTFRHFSSMILLRAITVLVFSHIASGESLAIDTIKDNVEDDQLVLSTRILQENQLQHANDAGSIDKELTCGTSINKLPDADRSGTKKILIVRVVGLDANGKEVRPRSAKLIHNDLFGSDGDDVNLASQIKRCSFNRDAGSSVLTVLPDASIGNSGVVDVKITTPLLEKKVTKRDDFFFNTVVPEAIKMGYWPSLLTSFDYTFFVLPSGLVSDTPLADPTKPNKKKTEGTNWSGFARPDLKIAVINTDYVKGSYIQVHEFGHLLSLAHSGQFGNSILDQYGHDVGFMGGSTRNRFNDDEKKCFNGAKSWQLGWYEGSETCLRTDKSCFKSKLVGLVGLSDYVNPQRSMVEGFKFNVVVRVIENGTPVYLMYNKADGLNDDTGECRDGISLSVQVDGRGLDYRSAEGPCLSKVGDVGSAYGELNYYFYGKIKAPKKTKQAELVAVCIYNKQWATENILQAKDACCAEANGYECCTDADCHNKDASCNPTTNTCEGGTPTECGGDDDDDDGGGGGGNNNGGGNTGGDNTGGGNTGSSTGDPHITTFDGFAYDCQARGDVVLIRSLDSEFEIQGRYSAAGTRVNGVTLTTGLAIREEGVPTIQISLPDPTSIAQGCPVDFFVDGNMASLEDGSGNPDVVVVNQGSQIVVSYPQTGVEVVLRQWISGSFGCSFSTSVFLPYSYRSDEQLVGILGSPNGDTQDDWMEVNGTTIPRSSGNLRGEYAYNYCVRWCIPNEIDSLFEYTNSGDSFNDIEGCSLPYNSQLGNTIANAPDAIVELCGGDEACILDGVAGDAQDAANYLQGEEEIGQYREERIGVSLRPSMEPSAYASHEPSTSIKPTVLPSFTPSSSPTKSSKPSQAPTAQPSNIPSNYPSLAPSQEPSNSMLPSTVPSILPTQEPSVTPSVSSSKKKGKSGKHHSMRARRVGDNM